MGRDDARRRPQRRIQLAGAAALGTILVAGCPAAHGTSAPGPGTACGTARTAADVPVIIEVATGSVACSTALKVENEYAAEDPGRPGAGHRRGRPDHGRRLDVPGIQHAPGTEYRKRLAVPSRRDLDPGSPARLLRRRDGCLSQPRCGFNGRLEAACGMKKLRNMRRRGTQVLAVNWMLNRRDIHAGGMREMSAVNGDRQGCVPRCGYVGITS